MKEWYIGEDLPSVIRPKEFEHEKNNEYPFLCALHNFVKKPQLRIKGDILSITRDSMIQKIQC